MRTNQLLAVLILSLAGAGAAHAQQAPTQTPVPSQPPAATQQGAPADQMRAAVEDKFKELDANGDGVISKEEASKMKGLTERFASADKNKDSKLDRGEFAFAMGL